MIRDFSKEELAPVGNDTELTLGAGAFLAMGCGLLLICGICFGLGYAMGHRSSADQGATAMLPAQDTKASVMPVSSSAKPGAATQMPPLPAPADGAADPDSQTGQVAAAGRVAPASANQAADAQVRPAPAQATSKVQGWMVQIAAVSHAEDAQVLVDALRKRGYEVTARRDVSDNLIHVQTGPFVNRNDANAMRQKLLSDGYNAIVQ